jgi:hypothetical protein
MNYAEEFDRDGFIIIRDAFDINRIIDIYREINCALAHSGKSLYININGDIRTFSELDGFDFFDFNSARILNLEQLSMSIVGLLTLPTLMSILNEIDPGDVTLLQTLTYNFSSQQGEHSDKFLVSPPWAGNYDRRTLKACWFAMDVASEENGALIVYPGSHKIQKQPLSCFGDYGNYVGYLKELLRINSINPVTFYAKPGDVLVWGSDLIHAGGVPTSKTSSRLSLVAHYANISSDEVKLLSEHDFSSVDFYRRSLYGMPDGTKLFL